MNNSNCDIALVQQAVQGDHAAFKNLIEKYRQKIYIILYFMLRNEEDALDLVQDTFIKMYQSIRNLKNPALFSPWLKKITINLAINFIKKKERFQKYKENFLREKNMQMPSPEYYAEYREMCDSLKDLILQLPPKQRAVIVLCDIENHSYKEIAVILKCSIGTVMSRLYYARDNLRKGMQQLGYAESVTPTLYNLKIQ